MDGWFLMPDLDVITMPALSRIPRVELMAAGTWALQSGPATFGPDDFMAAVAALACPAVRNPVLKLGHSDPRFDGEPTIGWVDNLAVTASGMGLVGDFAGMPGWLGEIAASAFPDRSVEGQWNFVCQIGHVHPFVVTAVALLGVTRPGIGALKSLQDIAALYGVTAAAEVSGVPFAIEFHAAAGDVQTGAMVALIPSEADAQRLVVDGGEPVDQLHVTLRYLGTAADIDPANQTTIIDAVTAIAERTPPIDGDGFSVALFNPTNPDRETCIAIGINSPALAELHDQVESAVDSVGVELPPPMKPYTAHLTLIYTDDTDQVAALVDRTGPILFDRLRVAFAGEVTDIPLGGTPVAASRKDDQMPNPTPREVAAGVSVDDVRNRYYDTAPYDYWIAEIEIEPLQLIVCDGSDRSYRVPVTVDGDNVTFGPLTEVMVTYVDKPAAGVTASAQRLVYASRGESRPAVKASDEQPPVDPAPIEQVEIPPAAEIPAPEAPAAEPVQPPTEEDTLSTITSDVRSRLGLAEDAPDDEVLTALDAVFTKANTPAPEPVAASISPEYAAELARVSSELAEIKASKEADRREHLFSAAVSAGKVAPADVDTWKQRYDKAPDVISEILASIAPGTAVPVVAAGYASQDEPTAEVGLTDDELRLFTTTSAKG